MAGLYIVIPAYNESENIENCINDWYKVVEKYNAEGNSRLVIVNDGSKDNTYEQVQKLAESRPLLIAENKKNGGHGSAVLYGYIYAIEHGADYIFQTDSDGQTNPKEFDAFWEQRYEYDGIFGKRLVRGDGKNRAFVEKVVCLLLKIYFGVDVPDANAPFRLMKCDVVKKYLYKMERDYNLPNIMMTTYFAYNKERIAFKEITFMPRVAGVNSINIRKIIKIGWKALGDFRRLKKGM